MTQLVDTCIYPFFEKQYILFEFDIIIIPQSSTEHDATSKLFEFLSNQYLHEKYSLEFISTLQCNISLSLEELVPVMVSK